MPKYERDPYYLISEALQNREEALMEQWAASTGKKPWGVFGRKYYHYEGTLGLPKDSLQEFVDEMTMKKEMPYGLDIGSDTTALDSLGISGIAVALSDTRSEARKHEDDSKGLKQLAGDVLVPATWKRIREVMQEEGMASGFRLVTIVPEGGLKKVTANPHVHFRILQEVWRLTHRDHAIIVVQMKEEISHNELSSLPLIKKMGWIEFLNNTPGIEASHLERGIKLVRRRNAPESLPAISFST